MSRGLIVDSFAGGGGASLGIEMALGRAVDIAINHDPEAIAMHRANHPDTRHFCESVWDVKPKEACAGRAVDLMWASPDCKDFSKAKGGPPVRSREVRSLAWVVVKWAQKVRPRVIVVENVEEFIGWGPLNKHGVRIPERQGETFSLWVRRLRRLGYEIEWRDLRACDYGAPTIRKRLFIVARCDGEPITWPEPTHGPGLEPYRTAAECIDWSIPCPSIFERKRPLTENTLRRIANGIRKFVIKDPNPFIVTYYGPKSPDDFRGQGIDKPLATQSTENRFGLVTPFLSSSAHTKTTGRSKYLHSVEEPMRTTTTSDGKILVAPYIVKHFGGVTGSRSDTPFPTITSRGTQNQLVTAFLARYFGQSTGQRTDKPAPTVTAGGQGKTALMTSHLVKMRGTSRHGQSLRQPMATVTAGGLHIGEVRAFLIKYYGQAIGQSVRKPAATVTTRDRLGLVTVAGQDWQIADIGMRMLSPRELYRAQGFPDSYKIDAEYDRHGQMAFPGLGKPLTKTAQVRMVGNSVCPPAAEAVVRANCAAMARVEAA